MKESENYEELRQTIPIKAHEQSDLSLLSALIQGDGLRYERLLEAEEEVNEL